MACFRQILNFELKGKRWQAEPSWKSFRFSSGTSQHSSDSSLADTQPVDWERGFFFGLEELLLDFLRPSLSSEEVFCLQLDFLHWINPLSLYPLRAILRAGNGLKCFLKRSIWDAWLTYCSLTPGDWVRLLLGALLCLMALIRPLLWSFLTVPTRLQWLEKLSEAKCLRRMHGSIIDLWPLVS